MKKTLFLFAVSSLLLAFLLITSVKAERRFPADTAIELKSRLELFIDNFLIDKLAGKTSLKLHHPVPREIVLRHDQLWEGSGSGYHSVFKDGDIYRMYYKAWQHEASSDMGTYHPLYCAYAESKDGINWTKPNLGLYEFNGSKNNNIVMVGSKVGNVSVDAGHPAVFKDENPNAAPDARYKAFLPTEWKTVPKGLMPFKSGDGIHWSPMSDLPVITDGMFDSQNLGFWDTEKKVYRAYWRHFQGKIRGIRTATSKDFLKWQDQADVTYLSSPEEELYTNQIKAYHRAPHIFIGFPARYIDRGWSESMKALPEPEEREKRAAKSRRYGTALTESLLMTSRNGVMFNRWNEAFLRPGVESNGTWTYGDQYIAWHLVETKSERQGAPDELSLYATESYWKGTASVLRRYTLRLDGFVSASAPMDGGELVTKPFTFSGRELFLNFSTSAAGDIKVEILDENGKPIPGYTLADCSEIFGDTVSRTVHWKDKGTNVAPLQGKKVKLRFVLRDADLYSMQFR